MQDVAEGALLRRIGEMQWGENRLILLADSYQDDESSQRDFFKPEPVAGVSRRAFTARFLRQGRTRRALWERFTGGIRSLAVARRARPLSWFLLFPTRIGAPPEVVERVAGIIRQEVLMAGGVELWEQVQAVPEHVAQEEADRRSQELHDRAALATLEDLLRSRMLDFARELHGDWLAPEAQFMGSGRFARGTSADKGRMLRRYEDGITYFLGAIGSRALGRPRTVHPGLGLEEVLRGHAAGVAVWRSLGPEQRRLLEENWVIVVTHLWDARKPWIERAGQTLDTSSVGPLSRVVPEKLVNEGSAGEYDRTTGLR